MAFLEIEDLVAGYGAYPVLHGINFEVEQGETCVLFGLNGAGKTTTVSVIAGLLAPSRGAVRFDGESIGGKSASWLVAKGVALCPEGRRVFPRLTVRQNLQLGAWVRRRDSGIVRGQRELVFDYFPRLAERETQLAGTLSGGEQQMLAIGRALMSRPSVLILDEPFLGLGPAAAAAVAESLADLRAERRAVVLVDDHGARSRTIADRVMTLHEGKLSPASPGDRNRR